MYSTPSNFTGNIGLRRYAKSKWIATMVTRVTFWPLMMFTALSACSGGGVPDRSLEDGNLPTPNSASSRAATTLGIEGQTNLTADLTPEARARRCASAVKWLNERMRTAGVLSQEQLSALATAERQFQAEVSTGEQASDNASDGGDSTTTSPAETMQTALECLRQLPQPK